MKKFAALAIIAATAAGALAQTVYYPDSARYIGDQEIKEAIGTVESNVVNTVNGEAGTIVIEAGDNVTITQTNGTINVAATDTDTIFDPADIGITADSTDKVSKIEFGTNELSQAGAKLQWNSADVAMASDIPDVSGFVDAAGAASAAATAIGTFGLSDDDGTLKWGDAAVALASDIPAIDANTVTNINNLGGTITISAGTNVSIDDTTVPGTITISATDTDTIFDPADIGITVDATDGDNIESVAMGTNSLGYAGSRLQWNASDVALVSDIPAAVDPSVLEHDVTTSKTELDAQGASPTITLTASDKNEVWVKWSEDQGSDAEVTIALPPATQNKIGTLVIYVDEVYDNGSDISQIYKFATSGTIGLPSGKPWETSTGSAKSLWKFEFENIPGVASWYFTKATEFIVTAAE